MPIKSGQQITLTALGATDATIIQAAAGTSVEIYTLTLHNTGSTGRTVEIFLSADATSAAAERVAYEYVDANQTKSIRPVTVAATQYLIGKASGTGINVYGTYTLRNGTDV